MQKERLRLKSLEKANRWPNTLVNLRLLREKARQERFRKEEVNHPRHNLLIYICLNLLRHLIEWGDENVRWRITIRSIYDKVLYTMHTYRTPITNVKTWKLFLCLCTWGRYDPYTVDTHLPPLVIHTCFQIFMRGKSLFPWVVRSWRSLWWPQGFALGNRVHLKPATPSGQNPSPIRT